MKLVINQNWPTRLPAPNTYFDEQYVLWIIFHLRWGENNIFPLVISTDIRGGIRIRKTKMSRRPRRPPPQCKQRQTDMWQLLHLPWRMLIQNFTGRESCCEIMSHQHIGWSAPAIAHIHRSRRGCRCLRRGILEHTLHDTLSVSQTTIFSKHKHALSGALAVVHRGS